MLETTVAEGSEATGKLVHAAGAVLWRHRRNAVEVALIHRPRYDDWSLPKGKVDPGETEPVTAVREILEETGQHAHLGRRLGAVSYPVTQGLKRCGIGARVRSAATSCPITKSMISSGYRSRPQ